MVLAWTFRDMFAHYSKNGGARAAFNVRPGWDYFINHWGLLVRQTLITWLDS